MNLSSDDLRRILQQPGYAIGDGSLLDTPRPLIAVAAPAVTPLQAAFETRYRQLGGVGEWVQNYRFLPHRKLELDYAMPGLRIGVEVNGGQWVTSGHSSGRGLHRDALKQNLAVVAGWNIFWLTTDMLQPGSDPAHVQRIVDYVKERPHDLE